MSIATSPFSPTMPVAAEPVTPDDLLKMGQQGLFELVDGEVIAKPMGSLAGKTTAIVTARLLAYVTANQLGEIMVEVSFRCFPEKPDQVRRPDIAFIAAARLASVPIEGHVPARPDLAVEIIFPGDGVCDLDGKLVDYRAAGVPLTWVVNPASRLLRIYRADNSIQELHENDMLGGEGVLPGFSVPVRDLLPM